MSDIVRVDLHVGTVTFHVKTSLRKADLESLREQVRKHVDAGFDKAIDDLRAEIRQRRKTS